MSDEKVTEEEFEEALRRGFRTTARLYLAQQIAAAEIRGIREGWEARGRVRTIRNTSMKYTGCDADFIEVPAYADVEDYLARRKP